MSDFTPGAMKILLVDDTPANLDVLRDTLQGYQLAVAQDGTRALKVAGHFLPHLILLDVMMPGMDGYEVARQLKADAKTRAIPIIFITAKNDPADILRGFEAGCVDYIIKPFQREEVCARVNTHLNLQASRRALEDLNAQKDRFLGIVAHDLRNPLTGIAAYTEMMLSQASLPTETLCECLRLVNSTAQQMLTLVNDLLDSAAIQRGKLEIQLQPTDFRDLLEKRVKICLYRAQQRGITIALECASLPPVKLDPHRITQVVDNLLGNAVKFSPADSLVQLCLYRDGDSLCLQVQDQGPGLSPELQQRLFGEFETAHLPGVGEKSTGLGLAIAHKIACAHGGQIDLACPADGGSVFTLRLPMRVG